MTKLDEIEMSYRTFKLLDGLGYVYVHDIDIEHVRQVAGPRSYQEILDILDKHV